MLRNVLHTLLAEDGSLERACTTSRDGPSPRSDTEDVQWTAPCPHAPTQDIAYTLQRRKIGSILKTSAHTVYAIKQGQRITAVDVEGLPPMSAADGKILYVDWTPGPHRATTKIVFKSHAVK